MGLTVAEADLKLVSSLDEGVVLGIILEGKTAKLRAADPAFPQGHVDWLGREPTPGVTGGFSLIVKKGMVTHLFAMSVLNPGPDPILKEEWIQELQDLLPLAGGFRVLRY